LIGYYEPAYTQIILGGGYFTFGVTVGGSTGHVAVGDFNGDGKQDLTWGSEIALGNGDGTFGPVTATVDTGEVMVVGDFNGDGKLDMATAGQNTVAIVLGNGNGTFQAQKLFIVGGCSTACAAAVGDFNGDGKLDLAVADSYSNTVTILTNTTQYSVVVADFNGDGRPDLAVVGGTNTVSILTNTTN